MKSIKQALTFIAGAAYASGFWASVMFWDSLQVLMVIPLISTFLLLLIVCFWLAEHWNDDNLK